MRQKKLLFFALVALLALASVACAKLQARDNLNKGVRAFNDGNFEAAINYFQEAMQLDPGLTDAEVYMATAYSRQYIPGGMSTENQRHANLAIETYQRVLERDPNNVSATAGLAFMYQNTNELPKAREYYIKQTQLAPDNEVPYYAVGSVNWIMVFDKINPPPEEEQRQLVDEGLQYLERALDINPEYEDAMSYVNLLYREKARLTEDEAQKEQLFAMADEWFDKAMDARRRNQEKRTATGVIPGQ